MLMHILSPDIFQCLPVGTVSTADSPQGSKGAIQLTVTFGQPRKGEAGFPLETSGFRQQIYLMHASKSSPSPPKVPLKVQ